MRKITMLGAAAMIIACGAAEANAAGPNPNVPTWSPYSIMGYGAGPMVRWRAPIIEGRSAYTLNNPEGPLNDYYKGVGMSDDINDCNTGCVGVGGR
jgi:hypothetical protein